MSSSIDVPSKAARRGRCEIEKGVRDNLRWILTEVLQHSLVQSRPDIAGRPRRAVVEIARVEIEADLL